ncbi:MAG: amidohydrolase family protein [Sphingomonadales bacterium]|nr:amidohydrolase family protein [Sphingomonadales bacterium]
MCLITIVARLRERASTPPGEWIRGYFFDDTKVTDKRSLTRADLDRVSTQHPVFVQHRGGHSMFFNSAAFALAGITATPRIRLAGPSRAMPGEPDGRVTDNAVDLFYKDSVRPRMEVPQALNARARQQLSCPSSSSATA